jgi:hypothetical protein
MIDKISGKVVYAVVSFGGFLGIGEDYYPMQCRTAEFSMVTCPAGGYPVRDFPLANSQKPFCRRNQFSVLCVVASMIDAGLIVALTLSVAAIVCAALGLRPEHIALGGFSFARVIPLRDAEPCP